VEHASHTLKRSLAILFVAVNLFCLGACTNSRDSSLTPATAAMHKNLKANYIEIDDPDSSCTSLCTNEVAGINDSRDIVGNYSNCSDNVTSTCNTEDWSCATAAKCMPCPLIGGAASWSSYTAVYSSAKGSYTSYASVQFPDTSGQYMYAISNRPPVIITGSSTTGTATPPPTTEVGCTDAFSGENGIWPLEYANGLWSVVGRESSGCGNPNSVSALVGYDNTNPTPTMVGFYNDNSHSCNLEPWEVYRGGGDTKLAINFSSFAATDVVATGVINSATSADTGIVGFARNANTGGGSAPALEGWYVASPGSTAVTYNYTGATATAFDGIALVNGSPVIVGWYTDKSNVTHGLWATVTAKGVIDATAVNVSKGLTVVSGVNKNGDICGWYTDTTGQKSYNGFVGLGVAVPQLKHPHQHLATKRIAS
jgi:hypothetical protein